MSIHKTPIIEKIIYGLGYCESESAEFGFYWNKCFDDIEKYVDPRYDPNEIINRFYDTVSGATGAARDQGFKDGLAFGIKMLAELFPIQEPTQKEIEEAHKSLLRKGR